MRLISPRDDELFGLAYAAAQLGKADALLAGFERARRDDPADADAANRHALALMATLSSVGANFEAHARFTFAIEAFDDVLEQAPDHWLARYSRARLRALVPSGYGALPTNETNLLGDAREDLEHLVRGQADHPHEPYFASTLALAAVVDQLAGDQDPDRWPAHLEALTDCPRVPVALPHLGAVLCEPFVTLYAACGATERVILGEVMSALFGDQPAVVTAVRRLAVR